MVEDFHSDLWHRSVLLRQAVDLLDPGPGTLFLDGTVGGGGHTDEILRRSAPDGRVIGLDRDDEALTESRRRLAIFGPRVVLRHASFAEAGRLAKAEGWPPLDGILLDLGLSSHQLDTAARGFSFGHDGPLDMRFDQREGRTAAALIRDVSDEELAEIIWRFGEEPGARRIARALKEAQARGDLASTGDLARVTAGAVGGRRPRGGIHPATRTFQALRMAVNDELGALKQFLDDFLELLAPLGRVAIIAFHSLEDRAVKQALRRLEHPCTCPPGLPRCVCGLRPRIQVLTRKPVVPSDQEVEANPRARSARLRAAVRCRS